MRSLKKRLQKRKARRGEEEIVLQVTSLADIFVVVLVFLLKSYSADTSADIDVPADILLPNVTSAAIGDKGLKIQISQDAVKLDGVAVAELDGYRFRKSDLNADLYKNGTSKSLLTAIAKQKAELAEVLAQRDPSGEKKLPEVFIIADQKTPYITIQTAMASAAMNGFSEVKLAVVKEE